MKKINLLVLLALVLLGCSSTVEKSPNVIVVITDDQGYGDLGCNGNAVIQTPNIDAFSEEAISFTNYHVGTTCAPTRAGLMTGRNCLRNGVWHTIAGCSLLKKDEQTVANVFEDAGYATAMFGKWHLGDNHPFLPEDRGFQNTLYHMAGGVGQTPDYWLNDYMDDTYFRNGEAEKQVGYCTDAFFSEAIDFIKSNKDESFFCYLSLNAPHGPYNVPEEYYRMYEGEKNLKPHQKRFYGMISNIDDNFGQLRSTLQELGIEDNTILIFTTDNGSSAGMAWDKKEAKAYGYNANMRGMKGSEYDGGHRVPFIMRWADGGYVGGRTFDQLAAHVDFLPTMASLSGIDYVPTKKLDGADISPYLMDNSAPKRFLVTDTQRQLWPVKGKQSCVMDDEWRLVNGKELYHIPSDAGQKINVIDQHPEIATDMQAFYDEWWADAETEFACSYIEIGARKEDVLTCHDVYQDKGVAWNQMLLRKGNAMEKGYWNIDFLSAGQYEFILRRWPKESSLALGAESDDAIAAKPWWDAQIKGEAMAFTKAYLYVGDKVYEQIVDNNETGTSIKVEIDKGETQLTAAFELKNGEMTNAFYVDVIKLD